MKRYRAIEIPMISTKGYTPQRENEVIIIQYDDKDKSVWVPSTLTDFIYHKYNGTSNNTKIKAAGVICEFVNFLNEQVSLNEDSSFDELKTNGLEALNHIHLAKYINHISYKKENSNTRTTVKVKETYLLKFYSFIHNRGISKKAKITKKLVPSKDNVKRGRMVEISPFDLSDEVTVTYPEANKEPSRLLKDMDVDVWNRFLEYAEEHYPNIALGVAFQCMGGIRAGGVVNLTVDSVELFKSSQHMRLDIRDRQKELFGGRDIRLLKSQIKVPRANQPVFNFNGELFNMWDRHISRLCSNTKRSNQSALFIDGDNNPMSGDTYQKHFYKLKRDFINFLDESGFAFMAKKLSDHSWGTHIGRHIFTNHLIKIGAVNGANGEPVAKYLMALRGDESEKSSSEYIDTKAVIDVVVDKLNIISDIAKML